MNWALGSSFCIWAPFLSLVAVPLWWNRQPHKRVGRATIWFLGSGVCFWWGGAFTWVMRDGLGPGVIQSHGWTAFERFIGPFLFFDALFCVCFGIGVLCLQRPRSSR